MKRIDKPLKMIISAISVLFFLTVVISVVMQIVFRFVLRISVPWTEELARLAIIWMAFFGIILVQADREMIRTDFFIARLPLKIRKLIERLINIASIILLLAILRGAIEMLEHASTMTMSAIVWLNASVMYYPVIIATPLIIIYLIRDILLPISEKRKEN